MIFMARYKHIAELFICQANRRCYLRFHFWNGVQIRSKEEPGLQDTMVQPYVNE